MIIHAHVIVSGRVQGVGYRAWTKREAIARGLVGWVKNLPDGSVAAAFEGEEVIVKEMLEAMNKGPRFAKVEERIERFKEELQRYEGFEVQVDF